MEYRDLIQEVEKLSFIADRQAAESAIKCVLGILASRLDEEPAREFVGALPTPLDFFTLRGRQSNVTDISADQYISSVASQFSLDSSQAHDLVSVVLHMVRENIPGDTMTYVERNLPNDWTEIIESA